MKNLVFTFLFLILVNIGYAGDFSVCSSIARKHVEVSALQSVHIQKQVPQNGCALIDNDNGFLIGFTVNRPHHLPNVVQWIFLRPYYHYIIDLIKAEDTGRSCELNPFTPETIVTFAFRRYDPKTRNLEEKFETTTNACPGIIYKNGVNY